MSHTDAKEGLASGESADEYLTRLFRQEALDQGSPQVPLRLDIPVSRRGRRSGRLSVADEAGVIWQRARRTTRRRLLIAAGSAGVLAVIAVCQGTRKSNSSNTAEQVAAPTGLPSGADVAPANPASGPAITGIPAEITPPSGDLPPLAGNPVRRATLLMALSRTDTSPIVVLGDDGRWRKIDAAPALTALWLHAGALSPDGLRAAFGTSSGTTVVDLTTGKSRDYTATPEPTRPVWLSPRHLLLGVHNLVDVVSGETRTFATGPTDVVMPQHDDPTADPASRLIELLSVGEPSTAAARVRRWSSNGTEVVTPINGPLAELVGPWRGGGFGLGNYAGDDGLLVRVCAINDGGAGVVVVRAKTAHVERVLVTDPQRSGTVRLLGWSDPVHVLLALVTQGSQQVMRWDIASGAVNVVSTVHSDGVLAFPDLSSVA